MSDKYQFTFHPVDGYLISSMHCEISEGSLQELTFFQFVPYSDSWSRHCCRPTICSTSLIGTNATGTYHDWYCGWFPSNPLYWCSEVFGWQNKNEFSDFLHPLEKHQIEFKEYYIPV
jgi:hypothetical protein